jgi:hypothetical protein
MDADRREPILHYEKGLIRVGQPTPTGRRFLDAQLVSRRPADLASLLRVGDHSSSRGFNLVRQRRSEKCLLKKMLAFHRGIRRR